MSKPRKCSHQVNLKAISPSFRTKVQIFSNSIRKFEKNIDANIMTKSSTHLHNTHAELYHSCERATIQPETSIEEIPKIEFASRKNSLESPYIIKMGIAFPETLRKLMIISRLIEYQPPPLFTTNDSPILNSLILLSLDLLDNNTTYPICLNEFWNIITNYLNNDKPVQYVNNLQFLMNNKQKIILWIYIKIYEHKLEDIINLILSETEFKEILRKNCKLLIYEKEIISVLATISSYEYNLNGGIIKGYELFLNEIPKTSEFSFHFSKYIKNSSIQSKKENLTDEDPIALWRMKSKTLNFNEVQANRLRKETQEIEELIYDNDFLSNFLRKYYKDAPSPKNSFGIVLKKHKNFLDNLFEDLKNLSNLDNILESKESFMKDFTQVRSDLLQRLEDINYLKSHTYPNDFQKEEQRIHEILTHLDYLFSLIEQIFLEFPLKNIDFQVQEENEEDMIDKNDGIIELDYNFSKNNGIFNTSPSSTPKKQNIKFKKRSEKLSFERFSSIEFKGFKGKPEISTTISEQHNQCYKCRQNISQGLYIIGNNAAFCHYSGYWYCEDCIAEEHTIIPYKVLESFDFNEYSVSKESFNEISNLLEQIIINLPYDSQIIVKNQELFDFMVLKREIHLIYDFICDEKLVENLISPRLNLLLKENLFSLKNLCDIHNNSLIEILKKCKKYLILHIDSCKVCQKKGFSCEICQSVLKVYVFDIEHTIICNICKRIYHQKCWKIQGNCKICKK